MQKENVINILNTWRNFMLSESACFYYYKDHWDETFWRNLVLKNSKKIFENLEGDCLTKSDLKLLSQEELKEYGFVLFKELHLLLIWILPILDQEELYSTIAGDYSAIKDDSLDVRAGCIALGFELK